TAEAFDSVEILANPPTPEPSPIPVVSGDDATLLITMDPFSGGLLLGRRENALGDPLDGILVSDSIKLARPSVSGDGTVAVFVNGSDDLCVIATDDPLNGQCLGLAGAIHSAALSPDGRYAAFVLNDPATGQVDNRISVYEFATDATRTYDLLAPVVDGTPVDNVLYADSLIFSSDSKQLIYDAASQIHFGAEAVTRWSIFSINLATDSSSVLVPPLALADFGNPNVGRAGNRYLSFDAQETATGKGIIMILDLFTGEFGVVGSVGAGVGYPCFNGDESAIFYTQEDPTALVTGYSLVKQPLTPTRLEKSGGPTVWYSDAQIGVTYRRGSFVGANEPPIAAVTAPSANASFGIGARIAITATASDADGSIGVVEFYDGSEKIGEDNSSPFTFTWISPPSGNHRLIARAKDNLGAVSDSPVIPITVAGVPVIPAKISGIVSAGRIQLRLEAPAGSYAIEQSADLRNWTERFPVVVTATGVITADDAVAAGPRFYRSRKK
ncbi:MAG TPA: Ig-like domain-containing protein, partial [Verrucomicrobiae bacterium]|nr:Ig-like domain-containing protein [Verrucomicrobiae bacterium]